ncbi:MAG: hypothetical protein KDC12_02200, partial [Flavobacteriales bacterium]|nr:hypothetical protein [Flavobacteriales bacterium]
MTSSLYCSICSAIVLMVSLSAYAQNDICSEAQPLECGNTITFSTIGAQQTEFNYEGTCFWNVQNPGNWFVFQGNGSQVIFQFEDTGWETSRGLTLFESTEGCNALECATWVEAVPDIESSHLISFLTQENHEYFLLVNSMDSNNLEFEYTLSATCQTCGTLPVNIDLDNAEMLTFFEPVYGNTCCLPPGSIDLCDEDILQSYGLWYKMVDNDCMIDFRFESLSDVELSVMMIELT